MAKLEREFSLGPSRSTPIVVNVRKNNLNGALSDMRVFFKGRMIGRALNDFDIRHGLTITTVRDQVLKVQVASTAMGGEQINVTLNGEKLRRQRAQREGTGTGADAVIRDAGYVLFFIAAINMVTAFAIPGTAYNYLCTGLLYMVFGVAVLERSCLGAGALIFSVVSLVLEIILIAFLFSMFDALAGFEVPPSYMAGMIGFRVGMLLLLMRSMRASVKAGLVA